MGVYNTSPENAGMKHLFWLVRLARKEIIKYINAIQRALTHVKQLP